MSNVESISRDAGHQSFPLFTRSLLPKNRNRRLYLVGGLVAVTVLIITITATRPGEQDLAAAREEQEEATTFYHFNCSAVTDDKYYRNVVADLDKNQWKACLDGRNGECTCKRPSFPEPDASEKRWNITFQRNLDLLHDIEDEPIDVLMLGDSLFEHWLGTNLALHPAPNNDGIRRWADVHELYLKYFRPPAPRNDAVRGLALGLGEDGYSELHYRIINGEVPSDPNIAIPIVWLMIGINDIFYDACSPHAIVASYINMIEAIRDIRGSPGGATSSPRIVINSIIPTDRHPEKVRLANERLYCLTERYEDVEFFDATSLFDADSDHVFNRNNDLYFDRIHPNAQGYDIWGAGMVARVKQILAEQEQQRQQEQEEP